MNDQLDGAERCGRNFSAGSGGAPWLQYGLHCDTIAMDDVMRR
jgi:hypothetical protein